MQPPTKETLDACFANGRTWVDRELDYVEFIHVDNHVRAQNEHPEKLGSLSVAFFQGAGERLDEIRQGGDV